MCLCSFGRFTIYRIFSADNFIYLHRGEKFKQRQTHSNAFFQFDSLQWIKSHMCVCIATVFKTVEESLIYWKLHQVSTDTIVNCVYLHVAEKKSWWCQSK